MKLIVGLGNPGDRYQATRHNAGFWLVERFAAESHTVLRKDAKFEALVGRHEASGAWLMLPQSHMNLSGKPVQMLASFFKIAPADILVAHDELDFPPGVARIKQGGGIAGHNGLKDISARVGSHDYWRVRIGIGHPGDPHSVTDYVLHKPSQEDRAAIDSAIGRVLEVLPLVLAGDHQGAMLKLHTEPEPAKPERAVKREPATPAKAEAVEKKKARAAERPDKPVKAAKEGKPGETARAEKGGKDVKAGKEGMISSFLKKLIPGQDAARKK
ncbi:MAG: aminoacyl-tRNA hydrolase [Burkholderiales bacterium]